MTSAGLGRDLPDPLSPAEVALECLLLLPVAALHLRFGRGPLGAVGWALVIGGMASLSGPTRPLALGGLVLLALLLERIPGPRALAAAAGPLAVVGRLAESLWYEGIGHDVSTAEALLTPLWLVALLPLAASWHRRGAAVALLAPLLALQPSPKRMEAGVLLITVDTLRKDDGEAMQSFQSLAARGTVWSDCLATSGWTVPSLASLHTGLAPWAHGAVRNGSAWEVGDLEGGETLAERLPGPSVAVVTNPFVAYGLARGFEGWTNLSLTPPAPSWGLALLAPREPDKAETVVDATLRQLPQQGFVWVHLLDPHLPYAGLEANLERLRKGEIRPEGREAVREAYRADVEATDRAILRLLEHVGPEVRVVLTSDHGEEFWEHGGVEHGHTLYDELVEVPFVITGEVGLDSSPHSLADLGWALGVGERLPVRPLGNTLYGPDLVGVDDGALKLIRRPFDGTWMLLDQDDRPVEQQPPAALLLALPDEVRLGTPRPLAESLRALGYL